MENNSSLPFNCLLLDFATAGDHLDQALLLGAQHQSFYKGDKEENKNAAPYLIELTPDSDFTRCYFEHGWNNGWGVPLYSFASFNDVYRHFRKFLVVKTEEGKQLYFRFYDPSVLSIFLPTCSKSQVIEFFGPVDHFMCKSSGHPAGIIFSQFNGKLIAEEMDAVQSQAEN